MDFRRPLRVVTPTLEGDVLRVMAGADAEFTGGEVHRLVEHGSRDGVRDALDRLVDQGVVLCRPAGRAHLYRFNREHVAAPWIEGLAGVRQQLLERLRSEIEGWAVQPVAAAVFGSVARGEAGPESDLDVFLVRPASADEDTGWDEQVAALAAAVTRWTGNDARPLEFREDELAAGAGDEPVLRDVLEHGIEIGGSLRALRRRVRI
ncbi:MAG TPA: nucleotidyltransferase domain-containing protein [Thermoleophilaceae bacterium]|nr:nucleotidyltransferase domain-containing protein [Thermoleophilaceae bacterium]